MTSSCLPSVHSTHLQVYNAQTDTRTTDANMVLGIEEVNIGDKVIMIELQSVPPTPILFLLGSNAHSERSK